ncbi:MAG: hypothetical protein JWQ88_1491 [Rhodoferax sp.]|nr:hypothetical protein [Rhodoferax sp.]
MTSSPYRMTAAILVVYSDEFAGPALARFQAIVQRVDRHARLVVVTNNRQLKLAVPPGVTLLQGNNVLHEFGAWQTGLDHLRAQPDFDGIDAVIFGNDTFCHHRRMGRIEALAFSLGSARVAKARKAMACGELSTFGETFSFRDVALRKWICTYLFTLNRNALTALDWKVHASMEEIMAWVPGGTDEDRFFAPAMDATLREHLVAWLFGRPGMPQWRKGAALTAANAEAMRAKAFAIMSEKILTTSLMKSGVEIVSVFHQPAIYAARWVLFKYEKWRAGRVVSAQRMEV